MKQEVTLPQSDLESGEDRLSVWVLVGFSHCMRGCVWSGHGLHLGFCLTDLCSLQIESEGFKPQGSMMI